MDQTNVVLPSFPFVGRSVLGRILSVQQLMMKIMRAAIGSSMISLDIIFRRISGRCVTGLGLGKTVGEGGLLGQYASSWIEQFDMDDDIGCEIRLERWLELQEEGHTGVVLEHGNVIFLSVLFSRSLPPPTLDHPHHNRQATTLPRFIRRPPTTTTTILQATAAAVPAAIDGATTLEVIGGSSLAAIAAVITISDPEKRRQQQAEEVGGGDKEVVRSTSTPPDFSGGRRSMVKPSVVSSGGCGTGSLAIPLARRGAVVSATDISAAMVAEAEKKAGEELQASSTEPSSSPFVIPKFEVSDLESLNGKYDRVVCLDVLIHYPQNKADSMISHLASLAENRLVLSFAPKFFYYDLLKRIGELFPGPSKATRAYLHAEADV
ncbi:Magnesium protoporphyrin IX methyltransferase, chloroplastic-like protein [Drosera capensis]